MTSFTVRIELRGADPSDYVDLYEKMESKGFSKYITSNSGIKYQLPTAEYNYSSASKSRKEIRDLAYRIAKEVNDNPAVLVTESDGRAWEGLDGC